MPRLISLFDAFHNNLDKISAQAVAVWIKPVPQVHIIENYLANKILYPKTVPQTFYEMQIDLAILREVLKINAPESSNDFLGGNPFINVTLRKILIPAKFLEFVPDLTTIAWIFVDAFSLCAQKKDFFADLWTIVLTDDSDETVGSLILPQFDAGGQMDLAVYGKKYRIGQGTTVNIPCTKNRCEIFYKMQNGRLLGKSENAVEISGGKLGLIVDGRRL